MKIVYLVFYLGLMITLTACGVRIVNTASELDNRKTVGYSNYDATKDWIIAYKLNWNSTMPEDIVSLDISVKGNNALVKENSLEILIDGKQYSYSQLDDSIILKETIITPETQTRYAEIKEQHKTRMSYHINNKILNEMISANVLGLRIKFINNGSIEDIVTNKKLISKFLDALPIIKDEDNNNKFKESSSGQINDKPTKTPISSQSTLLDQPDSNLQVNKHENKTKVDAAELKTASPNKTADSISMFVTSSKAKLRVNPSQKAKVLKALKQKEEVQVIKQKEDWFMVELTSGEVGWCHKSVLAQKEKLQEKAD
jgi:Bacterial SH3 domain